MKKNIFITSALSILILASCQHKDAHSEEADAHEAEEKAHSTEIVISVEQAKEAGIVSERIMPANSVELFRPEEKYWQHRATKPQ